jgi:uroporphyrin-III C-methyltransferase
VIPLVSLVGAGPGAADLMTLRAVERLRAADVVFFDRLVDRAALDFARPAAERVLVGKAPGVREWSQPRINRLLVAAAREGRRVVRLKCGDPGVFGRAAEEIAALAEAGFPVEIVPGVTAASAAAAEIGRPLTDRAARRSVLLVSAHPAEGAPPLDWTALGAADATLAVYMGVARAGEIAAALMAGGADPATPVAVVERAGGPDARRVATTLVDLAATIAAGDLRNPAILLIDPPRRRAVAVAVARRGAACRSAWNVDPPGRRRAAALLRAAGAGEELRGAERLAARPLRRLGEGEPASRALRQDHLGDVRGRAAEPRTLSRPLRRLPRGPGLGLQDLPRAVRQQQVLGVGERGRPAG